MAKYEVSTETFYVVGSRELTPNPAVPTAPYSGEVEVPIGDFEDLRVRVALVRSDAYGEYEDFAVKSAMDVWRLMQSTEYSAQESIYIILLDTKNVVIGVQEVAKGGTRGATIEASLFFQAPILSNASAIILTHNHPSGKPKPSEEDRALTNHLDDCANMLGFRLLDHVIIGYDDYYSFADNGLV